MMGVVSTLYAPQECENRNGSRSMVGSPISRLMIVSGLTTRFMSTRSPSLG